MEIDALQNFSKHTTLANEIFFPFFFFSNKDHLNKHDLILYMTPKDMLCLEM